MHHTSISKLTSGSRRTASTPGRLREMPPFGQPDEPYPPPPEVTPGTADDPRGVYLPPPEDTSGER